MKFSMSNVSFNLSPVSLNATDSNGSKSEDVSVNLNSEGMSFGIEKMEMDISIAEITNLCGNFPKATTTEAEKAKAEEARAKANETLDRANELTDICRGILRKVNELKASTVPTPSAPTKSSRAKKAPSPMVADDE